MQRRSFALLAAVVLAIAACGGDDTADDTAGSSDDTTEADAGSDADGDQDTDDTVEISPDTCEDTPDPAVYDGDARPPAIRPCELPEELVVNTIRDGTGPAAEAGDTLFVNYTGIRSEDGTQFDSSFDRPIPLDFPLGRGGVIAGWDEGLVGAQSGALIKLDIPADMAYGDSPPQGSPIEAGDALTFIVAIEAVAPAVTIDDAPLDIDIPISEGAAELEIIDAVVGDGDTAEIGDNVVIQLMLLRGDNQAVLHNSWENNAPIPLLMEEDQSIPGLLGGLEGMAVGGTRIIIMPPDEAFGPQGQGNIGLPANTDLVAVVELVGVF